MLKESFLEIIHARQWKLYVQVSCGLLKDVRKAMWLGH
jgi:hypothetical protein